MDPQQLLATLIQLSDEQQHRIGLIPTLMPSGAISTPKVSNKQSDK